MVLWDVEKPAAAAIDGEPAGIVRGSERLAPATPPQPSPVKPRRHGTSARPRQQQQPDAAALSSELRRLLQHSSGAPGVRTAADWENLPLNVWDVIWSRHLDLPAQMALCLTSTRCWAQFHQQTLRRLCDSELRVAHASFAVHVRNGALLHPTTAVFLRAAWQEGCQSWYQLLDAFLRRLSSGRAHRSLTRSLHCAASSTSTDGQGCHGQGCHAASRSQRPCVEVQCQLPSTFSSAPASQAPYDTRHGFCYGHLPANFGGVKLCLLISGSERDAQYLFEDIRLRLRHVRADEHRIAPDPPHNADAAASIAEDNHSDRGAAAAEMKRFVLELTSMWPCRRGGTGVEAVPQEGAMYSHAP